LEEASDMPQSERSEIIKEFLKWLGAKTKQNGATRQECVRHIQVEITAMGAEEKRCEKYLRDCERAGLIYVGGLKFKLTDAGKNWLQRKVS
jgi:hypothetical protein